MTQVAGISKYEHLWGKKNSEIDKESMVTVLAVDFFRDKSLRGLSAEQVTGYCGHFH